MTYLTISAQIVTMLNTISDFNAVYDSEKKELEKYPCATVTALSHENEFADTHHNIRRFNFNVRVYYRTADIDLSEGIMQGEVDNVIATIEADPTINGSCDFAVPTSSRWGWAEREVPVRYCEITISAQVRLLR